MNEVEQVKVPVVNTIHTEEEMLITGDELSIRLFLDEYQVGIVNDMTRSSGACKSRCRKKCITSLKSI